MALSCNLSFKQQEDMFSLNDSMRYWLYNQPTDMRKSYHTLSGIVSNSMGLDPYNGDVYIFMNKSRNRIKLLHWEPGGLVIYSKLLETGTFGYPSNVRKDDVSGIIHWRDLVLIVEGIIEKPDSRMQRLEQLKKLRR
jgi:transposase